MGLKVYFFCCCLWALIRQRLPLKPQLRGSLGLGFKAQGLRLRFGDSTVYGVARALSHYYGLLVGFLYRPYKGKYKGYYKRSDIGAALI